MNMTGMSTQGGMMGNSMGMLGFGNSAASIPFGSPGVNPMRPVANTGPVQTALRNQIQAMPKGMLAPDQRAMMQLPMGGNQYMPAGNLATMQAGNMGGLAMMGIDPMTRRKVA